MKTKIILLAIGVWLLAVGMACATVNSSPFTVHSSQDTVPVTKKGITPPRNIWNYDPSQSVTGGKFGQVMGVKRYSSTLGDTLVGFLPLYVVSSSTAYLGSSLIYTAGNLTFSNGLTNTSGAVKLGGTLTQSTTLTMAANDLNFSGTGLVSSMTPGTSPSHYMYASRLSNFAQFQYGATADYFDTQLEGNTSWGAAKLQITGETGDTPTFLIYTETSGGTRRGVAGDSTSTKIITGSASTAFYRFANAKPSDVAATKNIMVWTGNGGTNADVAFAAPSTLGLGSVTSVGLSMPTGFSVSGSPVTSSGTLAVTTTLNGPLRGNGSGFTTGNIALGSEVSGTLPIANGGTGLTALGTASQLIRVNAGATALEYFTPTYLTSEVDGSTTNEIQNVSYTASTRAVAMSGGGTGFTFPLFTSTEAGLVPLSGGGTSNFLRADGTWAAPAGGVSGSGTTNYVPLWTSSSTLGNSIIQTTATGVGIGASPPLPLNLYVKNNTEAYLYVFGGVGATHGAFFNFGEDVAAAGKMGGIIRYSNAHATSGTLSLYSSNKPLALGTQHTILNGGTNYALYINNVTDFIGLKNNSPAERLDVNGNILLNGVIKNADGTAALPSYTFTNDLNTGIYRPTTDVIGLTVGGVEYARLSSGGLQIGTAGATQGNLLLSGSTSGTITVKGAAAAGTWTMTLPTGAGSSGQVLSTNGSGVTSWATAAAGTVTSVAMTVPTGLSVSGSPITSSGTLAITTTLNGPLRGNGSGFTTGNIALGSEVSGTLPIANGGTGLTALGTASQLIRVNAGATALEYFTPTYLTSEVDGSVTNEIQNVSYTASTRAVAMSGGGTGFTFPLFTSTEAGLAPFSGGGTSNFLRADGTWAAPAGGSPGGSTTHVQYNNAGAFGGSANFTFNGTTVAVANPLNVSTGSESLPSIVPTGDTNNGWWFPSADVQAWSLSGGERMRLATSSTADKGLMLTSQNSAAVVHQLTLYHNKPSPTDDDEEKILFDLKDSGGNQTTYATISAIADNVANGSEAGHIGFDVVVGGALTRQMDIIDTQVSTNVPFNPGEYSATNASALTAQDGWIIYVTSTNGTFTSIGFWGRENGTWVKL